MNFIFFLLIARQTKPLNIRQTTNRHATNPNKIVRQVVGLPPSKPFRGQTKVKSNQKFLYKTTEFLLFSRTNNATIAQKNSKIL